MDIDWPEQQLLKRDQDDRVARKRLDRITTTGSSKRKEEAPEGPRKTKRKKYKMADDKGGQAEGEREDSGTFL